MLPLIRFSLFYWSIILHAGFLVIELVCNLMDLFRILSMMCELLKVELFIIMNNYMH